MFEITEFPNLENEYSERANLIIDQLRKNKNSSYQNIKILLEGFLIYSIYI